MYDFFKYIENWYIDLIKICDEYYKSLIEAGVDKDDAEKIVKQTLNKMFEHYFNFW